MENVEKIIFQRCGLLVTTTQHTVFQCKSQQPKTAHPKTLNPMVEMLQMLIN